MRNARSVPALVLGVPALRRLVGAYLLFILGEYTAWIVVLVYAYQRGGATESGLVALAQLVPAVAFAPLTGRLVERTSPATVLSVGLAVQVTGMALAGAGALGDQVVVAYAGAILASTAVVTTRPSQTALLPRVVTGGDGLVAANVALGWAESTATVLSGLCSGVLLTVWSPGGALVTVAAVTAIAVPLTHGLGKARQGPTMPAQRAASEVLGRKERLLGDPAARLLFALLGLQWVVVGALDVLFVVLAIDVLQAGEAWAGYLQTAVGLGAMLASAVAVVFVGRRLGGVMLALALTVGGCLGLTAVVGSVLPAVALLFCVGASRALLDVSGRILLQRTVQPHRLARVFGNLEGVSMAGLAVGSLLVPAVTELAGHRASVLAVAALLPVVVLLSARRLLRIDAHATVPVVEITLLRSMRMFADLSAPALEGVARALVRQEFAPGAALMREGETGKDYFAIADGDVAVSKDGRSLGLRHAGDGVGEIALVRGVPRTATVVAADEVTAYRLDRDHFLEAVLGSTTAVDTVDHIVDERLRDADPSREE